MTDERLREALVTAWGSERKGERLTERVMDRLREYLTHTLAEVLPSFDDEGNAASDVAEGIADNILGLIGGYEPCVRCGRAPLDDEHGYGGTHAFDAALDATPEPTPRAQRLLKAESENRCGDLACETRRVSAAVRVMGGWKEHADYAWAVEAFEVEIGVRDPALLGKEPDNIPSRATIEAEAFARGQAATPQLPDPDAPLHVRRRAAADLAVWTAARLTDLGFGCEIIATWEARSGERTAAHVTTPNPAARLHERTEPPGPPDAPKREYPEPMG